MKFMFGTFRNRSRLACGGKSHRVKRALDMVGAGSNG